MTTTPRTTLRDELDDRPRRVAPSASRAWAFVGAAAGLAGIIGPQVASRAMATLTSGRTAVRVAMIKARDEGLGGD